MKNIDDNWFFPIKDFTHQIPQDNHPGAFGTVRKFDIHTGVDLYCPEGTGVFAVEDGIVIAIEEFTGPNAESPWWHETWAVLVKGKSGVVVYGEVEIPWIERTEKSARVLRMIGIEQESGPYLVVGDTVEKGDPLAKTKQVLKKNKGKPMCMLHLELYTPETIETVWWKKDKAKPKCLLDPTQYLLTAKHHKMPPPPIEAASSC